MRTREEIENGGTRVGRTFIYDNREKLMLEVLLDIRDLLSQAKTPEENQTTSPRYSPTTYQGSGVSRGDGVQTNNIAI